MTSASTLPNSRPSSGRFQISETAVSTTESSVENIRSWLPERSASARSRRPMYWLTTTAPPDASAVNR